MADPSWPEIRRDNTGDRSVNTRRRKRYLPSEQVINELVSFVPDLGNLADELRSRLSDPATETSQ